MAEIHRLMTAIRNTDENNWKMVRLIAYETWRKGAKNVPSIESYMPIGDEITRNEMTEEELDKVWKKYGKRN